MPLYKYKVLNPDGQDEFFEIEQKINDHPLLVHPITGHKVKRILTSPSLSFNHSSGIENNSLSPDNLSKNGFTKYEKDSSSGDFHRTVGQKGPLVISKKQINQAHNL